MTPWTGSPVSTRAARPRAWVLLSAYSYDDLGRRMRIIRGNGANTSYAHDNADRLTSLTQDLTGTANDLTLGFTYNPASQIINRDATTGNTGYSWTNHPPGPNSYASDSLNQDVSIAGCIGL